MRRDFAFGIAVSAAQPLVLLGLPDAERTMLFDPLQPPPMTEHPPHNDQVPPYFDSRTQGRPFVLLNESVRSANRIPVLIQDRQGFFVRWYRDEARDGDERCPGGRWLYNRCGLGGRCGGARSQVDGGLDRATIYGRFGRRCSIRDRCRESELPSVLFSLFDSLPDADSLLRRRRGHRNLPEIEKP